jgi:diaminopimelate epimerase
MHRQAYPGTLRLLGVVFAVIMLVSPSAFGQPLRATVVHVEGAAQTWHVTDKDGKIVEVQVPSQSVIDIQTSKEERPGASGTSGQGTGTVLATVVAVDTLTNRVRVQTKAGQVIELETSAKDRQIGEQVTLIVPR